MNPSLGSLGQLTVCFSFDSKTIADLQKLALAEWLQSHAAYVDQWNRRYPGYCIKLTNISDMALSSDTYIAT